MAKGTTFANALLKLIMQGVALSGLAEASQGDSLYVSLHSDVPVADQTESELAYQGYARVAVPRSVDNWTVTGNAVMPSANVQFAPIPASAQTAITNWAVGTTASGTGMVLWTGTLSPVIVFQEGLVPILDTTSFIREV